MTDVLFAVHLVVVLACAFGVSRRQGLSKQVFWPALFFKLGCGLCLGLLYQYYYAESDTFLVFRDASRLVSLARTDLMAYVELMGTNAGIQNLHLEYTEPRTLFLTKITSVFNLLTGSNYWSTGLYFSFLSFLASCFLVNVISQSLPRARHAAIVGLLFLPSAVFWTSGILKESLAVAGLFYLTGVSIKAWFGERIPVWQWLLAPLAFWVLWRLKYYYAGVFIGVAGTTLLYYFIIRRRILLNAMAEVLIWSLILVLPIILVSLLHPNFHLDRLLSVVTTNYQAYVALSAPGDVVELHDLRPSAWSMLANAPIALFSGLFRPFLWEASSAIQFLAALENCLLFLLFVGAMLRFRSYVRSPYRLLILTSMAYILLLAVFITLSAPNFGTLSRYRTGYISFFTFLILCNNPVFQYVERTFMRLAGK